MTVAVIAEKPSVARDIARVLKAGRTEDGVLRGGGYAVTWALGHLVHLPEPHQIDPTWKTWRREALPILPQRWPLIVAERTRHQFDVIRRLLQDPGVETVICATDAGREGELIFRYLIEKCGCAKPIQRLWISSLTPEAIQRGFAKLRAGAELDALADAARGRSRADWLVGMNLSRAATLAHDELFSVGRVQTPTLAMLVGRDREIASFVPHGYLEVVAVFDATGDTSTPARSPYQGLLTDAAGAPRRFALGAQGSSEAVAAQAARVEAADIAARALQGEAKVASVAREAQRHPPPLLFDLTELQRHANRLFGMSAQRTLAAAQGLYERHKLISYPRTDSRHLPSDLVPRLPQIVDAIKAPYAAAIQGNTGRTPPGRRFVDDRKVTDHHAIVPTGKSAAGAKLAADEERVFDLVCRRFLGLWQGDEKTSVTSAVTEVTSTGENGAIQTDRFASRGVEVEDEGWRRLEPRTGARGRRRGGESRERRGGTEGTGTEEREEREDRDGQAEINVLPSLEQGQKVDVTSSEVQEKTTRPPKHFTEATLLTAMETAGRALDDRELSDAMRERGLGTPATRAEIIETLLRREYIERRGRSLHANERGFRLIDRVHPELRSAAMTGEWEAKLRRIERGQLDLATFLREIEDFVRRMVAEVLDGSVSAAESAVRSEAPRQVDAEAAATLAPARSAPAPSRPIRREGELDLASLLKEIFGFETFRPFQEEVCRAAVSGRDGLLVMPTGAGKSLCYQLPGLARGGTTLVISPLIALMEDQTTKLRALGIRAERIHSGRARADSRAICRAYLDGDLEFLFVAPERFGVAGFPELLAKRRPTLVAVDEAHCISHWGHDFRPDYRLLGGRLPQLRPAPVLALTATATPRVQDDIVAQLALDRPVRSIHGFRRDNLGIEVVELAPAQRFAATSELLGEPSERPAIVYAPTRRHTEALAELLGERLRVAAYHAGLPGSRRDEAQRSFLAGELEVIVATIAFGMGIDKPDVRTVVHTGLPASLEGYYQEIGRAGRDGLPARAVLFYSWADRRTHEYFHQRDYPEVEVLAAVARHLSETPTGAFELRKLVRMDEESLANALDKLVSFRGARWSEDQQLVAGEGSWRSAYLEQRAHRLRQLDEMTRFASSTGCRMVHIVRHFGDQADSGAPCGHCDRCNPERARFRFERPPSADELAALSTVLDLLRQRDGQGTGRLYQQTAELHGWLDRDGFEELLAALERAHWIGVEGDTFTKDGQDIHFQRARLLRAVRRGGADLSTVVLSGSLSERNVPGSASRVPARARGRGGRKAAPGTRSASKPMRADGGDDALRSALRAYRLEQARTRGVPAYRVFSDRVLDAIASTKPRSDVALLAIRGVGPALVRDHGRRVLELCQEL